MKTRIIFITGFLCIFFGLAACAGYYQVKDPSAGSMYYTRYVDVTSGGAVMFEDARTGSKVTLQDSEIKKISKEEFQKAVMPEK